MRRRLLVRNKQLSNRHQQLLQQTTHPDLAAILGYTYTRGDQFIRTKHTEHSMHNTRANKTHTHTQAYSYELKHMLIRQHTLPISRSPMHTPISIHIRLHMHTHTNTHTGFLSYPYTHTGFLSLSPLTPSFSCACSRTHSHARAQSRIHT